MNIAKYVCILYFCCFNNFRFLIRHAIKFSSLRAIFNKILWNIMNEATNYSPEKLVELQEKSEKQLSNLPAMY